MMFGWTLQIVNRCIIVAGRTGIHVGVTHHTSHCMMENSPQKSRPPFGVGASKFCPLGNLNLQRSMFFLESNLGLFFAALLGCDASKPWVSGRDPTSPHTNGGNDSPVGRTLTTALLNRWFLYFVSLVGKGKQLWPEAERRLGVPVAQLQLLQSESYHFHPAVHLRLSRDLSCDHGAPFN